jgi:hypothetical protein
MLFKLAQQSGACYTIYIMRGVSEFILGFYRILDPIFLDRILHWALCYRILYWVFQFGPGAAAAIAQGQRFHGVGAIRHGRQVRGCRTQNRTGFRTYYFLVNRKHFGSI